MPGYATQLWWMLEPLCPGRPLMRSYLLNKKHVGLNIGNGRVGIEK